METAVDNGMVVAGGANGPNWKADEREVCTACGEEAKTADCGLAGQICEPCLDKQQQARWAEELRAAKVGDVAVSKGKDGFLKVLIVRENRMDLAAAPHLQGDGLLASSEGRVFGISLETSTVGVDGLGDVADLQVVSL